jgi:spore coat protein A
MELHAKTSSDGGPEGYFTRNGQKSEYFETEAFCGANEAVYHYPNEQDAGNNWYHDHAMGITRLNVYAGLAGLYKIVDPSSK